jgi:hypothetical protein
MTNQTPCNHHTPYKPQVEYYDEQTVIINGVQYQRVNKTEPQTLLDIVREWCDDDNQPTCEELVNRIETGWLPKLGAIEPPLYANGWEDCIKYLKENLK